ncbi:hypothetical protein Sme01_74680 [Sphaerisporangium melleum]|uniref:Uncharacterized protein n=1 Tax=Sphaerisporangium melleum TaxID=321316 RepID=A0A917RRN6_9ACTN|nr:hypothetical protein GCM10007964_74170 [Sphaerisporangium melleum]GII74992.1 hypothetical protein Sme01_74680 [Sphaerisporangium melleum]
MKDTQTSYVRAAAGMGAGKFSEPAAEFSEKDFGGAAQAPASAIVSLFPQVEPHLEIRLVLPVARSARRSGRSFSGPRLLVCDRSRSSGPPEGMDIPPGLTYKYIQCLRVKTSSSW